MILLFPDLDTLRLALTSNTVPAEVTLAPAAVSFDDQGRVYVESAAALPRGLAKTLDRLGVKGSKRHGADAPEDVATWVQIVPAVRDPHPPVLAAQAPVLFELSADALPSVVAEMLRLGNDRQSFRWYSPPESPDARRVLLRVIGPPYYTLLRALDRPAGDNDPVRAYVERAPRVWVEVGYAHPLANQVRAADGQAVLIRPGRDWAFLDDGPFQDVYDLLHFQLPASPTAWTAAKAPKKMTVPLRLAPGNAADVAELWVLRDRAVEQLDTLVRDADDRLTQRLMFAVAADADGSPTVVLRTRPSKLAPPVLPVESAVAYKPFWKLPNLFVPVCRRLHPTLRRDAVRRLLADDPDQVVWLTPGENGAFTPESVPDAAFRSLEDWVDYVIEVEQRPLAAWVEATRFDFDAFVCKDAGGPKPKPDKPDREPKATNDEPKAVKGPAGPKPAKGKGAKAADPAAYLSAAPEVKPPSEWKFRREELEKEFLAADGPLDAPERAALWPELAEASAGLGDAAEAAVCWLDALWALPAPRADWLAAWVRSELPAGVPPTRDEFDRRLANLTPQVGDSRAVVAMFLTFAAQEPVPGWLAGRLPAVQKFLAVNERTLPVRAVWLAGRRLAQLAGGDVLGLARVRDRLLQRLLEEGLSPERDLPSFLRFAGLKDSERIRVVRDKALDLHRTVRKWIDDAATATKNEATRQNLPFVDLLFAFALAKLGEATPARKLVEEARRAMEVPVPAAGDDAIRLAVVKTFLFRAFRFRVEQVLAGKAPNGPLGADLLVSLDEIGKTGAGVTNSPYTLAEYIIKRMREQSRVLEPQGAADPYGVVTKKTSPLTEELYNFAQVADPGRLADRVRGLYRDGAAGDPTPRDDQRLTILFETLPLAPRVGEAFTAELIGLVPGVLAAPATTHDFSDKAERQGKLVARAVTFAAHFDRVDLVQKLVSLFVELVRAKPDDKFKVINVVAGPSLRSLRKFGLRDEIDRFLTRLQQEVVQSGPADARAKAAAHPDHGAALLQTQLNLAAGWLTFGLADRAESVLEEARTALLHPQSPRLGLKAYTELAQAYVTALGQGPSETGLPRIAELFAKMDPARIQNTYTTAPSYSRLHLNLVEDVILAVVSDEFALGPAGRRWLDDDEYLVRKRVHADMAAARGSL